VVGALVGLAGMGGAWPGMAAPGDLDPTFAAGAVAARAVAVQPDGRVVVGGSRLTGLLASGANDTSFTSTQGPTSTAEVFSCVAVQADGRLVVGGAFGSLGGASLRGLARLLSDGKVDSSFVARVGGGQWEVQALEVEPDGSLLVGGTFETINDVPSAGLARLRPDGTLDPWFVPAVRGTTLAVQALARQENGRWLASRSYLTAGETKFEVVRLHADGAADASFKCDVDAAVHTIVVQHDRAVLLGGAFLSVNGRSQPHLARVAADGTLDTTFTPAVTETVGSLALQADGTLVVETTMETPLGALAGLHWVDAAGTRAGPFRLRDRLTPNLMLQHDGRLVAGGTAPTAAIPSPPAPVRLLNTPAVHALDVLEGGRVRWTRAGSAPETQQTTAEVSEDGGRTYGSPVPGLRVQGGWEFAGLGEVANRRLRLQARVSGGRGNGSSHLAEWITVAGVNRPTPEVYQPDGTLVNPTEGHRFPDTDVGSSANRTFTLRNTGTADLRLDAVVVTGPDASAFVLTTPIPAVLPGPYGSTTFGVSFRPRSAGDVTATLEFFSPDPLLGRFTVRLDGRGRNPAPSSNSELSDLRLGSGVLTPAFAPNVLAYTATQPGDNDSIQVTAPPASSKARVTIAGVTPSPNAYSPITVPLEIGANSIPIVVTAETGSQTTYQLTVTRASQPGAGHIDTAFVVPRSTSVSTAVPLPGGQLLVRGYFYAPDGASFTTFCVWLNADGSLLRALPTSVVPPAGDRAGAVAVQRDGRLLVAGPRLDAATGRYRLLQRFRSDGTPDPSFVSPLASATSSPDVSAIAVLPDDAILIAGRFAELGEEPRSRLAQLRPDGSLDTSLAPIVLGTTGWDYIETILVQPDGKILIGGGFFTVNGVARGKLARLHADGTVDDTFRPVVTSGREVTAMALQPDGKLIVAGDFSIVRGAESIDTQRFGLARFHPDGTLDTGFAPAVIASGDSPGDINTLALDALGRVYIGGSFSRVGGQPRKNMARLLPDGTVDPAFAPEFGTGVRCLVLEAQGTVLVAASEAWGRPTAGLVRLLNDAATDQLTVDATGRIDWRRGGSAPEVDRVWVEASDRQGGGFTSLGEATRSAQGWTFSGAALPPGGQVRAQAEVRVGYAGGSMTRVASIAPIGRPGSSHLEFFLNGTPVVSGAALDFPTAAGLPVELNLQVRHAGETSIPPLSVAIDGPDAARFAVVRPLPALGAGGDSELGLRFSPLDVGNRSARLRLTAPGVGPIEFSLTATAVLSTDTSLASLAIVDWTLQPAFSPGLTDYATEVAVTVPEVRLIAPPNHPAARLRVDGREVADPAAGTGIPLTGEWTTAVLEVTAQDGVSKGIYRLVVHRRPNPRPGDLDPSFIADVDPARFWKGVPQPDGGVMIQERISGPPSGMQLRRLKPDGSQDPGFLPYLAAGGFSNPLAVISLPDGGYLVSASANESGTSTPVFVRLRKNGVPDLDFGLRPGFPVLPARLQCLAVQPDGGILLGGSFTSIGGIARTSIARLNSSGVLDVSFSPVLASSSTLNPPTVACLAVQADGRILVGGTFARVDGVNRQFLARLERDGRLDPGFQPVAKSAPFAITFDSSNRILAFTDASGRQFNEYTRYLQNGTTDFIQRSVSLGLVNALPQADGRLLFGGGWGRVNGIDVTNLFRLEADGTVDPTMELQLPLEQSVSQMAGFQDGRLMIVKFENIDGLQTRQLFRVLNGTTSESLRVTDSSRIRWERQGNTPEAHYVTFALSTDGGVTFSDLGLASRVENGWELAGLALPGNGHIRAQARYVAGPGNRDSSLAESITAYSLVSGPREAWRQRHFGTDANVGPAADGEDPDGDGLTNFAEFAGGSDPNQASESPLRFLGDTGASELRITFVRSREAMESGVVWVVEWNDSLSDAAAWSSAGVDSSVISESANAQQVLARVPAGPLGRRFARLRISHP
jgi:uncharacterized delta-60 repeat protein